MQLAALLPVADPSGQGNTAESAAAPGKRRPTDGYQITPALCTGIQPAAAAVGAAAAAAEPSDDVPHQPDPPACWHVLCELYSQLAEPDLLQLVQVTHLAKCPGNLCCTVHPSWVGVPK